MFNKNAIHAIRIGRKRINGKSVKTVTISKKAGVKDFAKAAAASSRVMKPNHAEGDDDVWLGYAPGESGYPTTGYEDEPWLGGSGNSTTTTKQQTGFGKFLSDFGGGLISSLAKSDVTSGKNAGNILAGLGEDYIKQCIAKYKSGASMTEFERRVAMAAIALEKQGKKLVKQKAGDWIMNHLPEIGIGVLALVVLVVFVARR